MQTFPLLNYSLFMTYYLNTEKLLYLKYPTNTNSTIQDLQEYSNYLFNTETVSAVISYGDDGGVEGDNKGGGMLNSEMLGVFADVQMDGCRVAFA